MGVPILRHLRDVGDIIEVMGMYERAIVPVWEETGRDFDLEVIRANIDDQLLKPGWAGGNYWMWVLREDKNSTISGYLAWERHPDHTSRHVIAHLRMLLVNPTEQRKGYATIMLEEFEKQARREGCTKTLFDVVVGSPAHDFYARHDYRHWSNFMEKVL